MKRRGLSEKTEKVLELPTGALTSGVRMEITDDRRVVIEGCKRILDYEEDRICIATGTGQVRFCGRALCMTAMTAECAIITGRLLSIEYL